MKTNSYIRPNSRRGNSTDVSTFISERIIPAVFLHPETLFGGVWTSSGNRQTCNLHILTDGRQSHDGNGSFISNKCPYLICDASDPRTNAEIVSYVGKLKSHASRRETARYIADLYGISCPYFEEESEETRQRRERRRQQQRTAETMKFRASTASPSSSPTMSDRVIEYLNGRGVTRDLIDEAHIVYVNADQSDAEGYANYEAVMGIIRDRIKEESRPAGVGKVYHIAIPVETCGRLVGYVFGALPDVLKRVQDEAIDNGKKMPPKYRVAKFSDEAAIMPYLRTAHSRRAPWEARTLVCVEGIFDALTAMHALRGTATPDVAAYHMASINDVQASLIAKAGYERVILAVDYEGKTPTRDLEAGARLQLSHIESSADALQRVGVSMFVADLRTGNIKAKSDANSLIVQFGEAEFKQRIREANTIAMHKCTLAPFPLFTDMPDGSDVTAQKVDEMKSYLVQTIAEENNTAIRRQLTWSRLVNVKYGADTSLFDDYQQALNAVEGKRKADREDAERQQRAKAYHEAADLIAAGDDKQANLILRKGNLSDDEAQKLDAFRHPRTALDYLNDYDSRQDSIELPWKATIGVDGHPFNLSIPQAGTFIISAPTSHGKTRVLENIIVNMMPSIPYGKSVYYVHFEEHNGETIYHLANILANETLAEDNIGAIKTIRHTGDYSGVPIEKVAAVGEALGMVAEWINSRRLILVDDEPTMETIQAAVEEAAAEGRAAAVCIDYVQKLKTSTKRFNTKKELMEYALDNLNTTSRDLGVPFILTSQLGRQCVSPWTMDVRQNGDATNIEQSCYTDILVWNSKYRPLHDDKSTPEGIIKAVRSQGFAEGIRGHLAFRVGKNRTGKSGEVWGVLKFDEITGKIYQDER